jgi:hypothetical protein
VPSVATSSWPRVLRGAGRAAEAEPVLAAIAVRAEELDTIDAELRASWIGEWGLCLAELGRWKDAEPRLRRAHEMLGADRTVQTLLRVSIAEVFIRHFESIGDAEGATRWRAELASINAATRPTTVASTQATAQ